MKALMVAVFTLASATAFANPNDPWGFNRQQAEQVSGQVAYSAGAFANTANQQCGTTSGALLVAARNFLDASNQFAYNTSWQDFYVLQGDLNQLESKYYNVKGRWQSSACRYNQTLVYWANQLDQQLAQLQGLFSYNPPPPPPTWYQCTASDDGWEEHWGGHTAGGYDQWSAQNAALNLCHQFHPGCHITRCWQ